MNDKPIGLNATGKVAVLTAVKKLADTELKKAREEADKEAYQLYESFGSDRLRMMLNGSEVGTMSLRFSTDTYEVEDKAAFEEFCLLNGLAEVERTIRPEFMGEAIRRIAEETPGAIEERVELHKDASKFFKVVGDVLVIEGTDTVIPGVKPAKKSIIGTTVRGCDPKDVIPALQSLPGGLEQALLGGGEDD